MADYANLYLERANIGWRAATEADPNFALAYAWIAFNSRIPDEAATARAKAKALAPKVTPGEQLMIQWIANIQEGNFLTGIASLNDLLEMYPKDPQLFDLAGNWMMEKSSHERAEKLLEHALALDKNYAAALNDLAYCYARNREYDKAVAAMERYIALQPRQPNPQDSYAEILRMSGNFDAALEHYRAALKLDPQFVSSQVGLADTYALIGNQARARLEYDKALSGAATETDRLDYSLQRASTWARESNLAEADKAFTGVAEKAHAGGLDLEEAQAYRMMSLYQVEDGVALKHLQAAEEALGHSASLAQSDRDEERSRILRYRVARAAHSGDKELAEKTVKQLEVMAGSSRSLIIESSYHGAAGAWLMSQQKTDEAISHLEEDTDNPYTLELLSRAYFLTGANDKRHEAEVKLRAMNTPTLEQALVVPAVRSRRPEGE
jgi:tetratricopeptide (TPR) repeat protein